MKTKILRHTRRTLSALLAVLLLTSALGLGTLITVNATDLLTYYHYKQGDGTFGESQMTSLGDGFYYIQVSNRETCYLTSSASNFWGKDSRDNSYGDVSDGLYEDSDKTNLWCDKTGFLMLDTNNNKVWLVSRDPSANPCYKQWALMKQGSADHEGRYGCVVFDNTTSNWTDSYVYLVVGHETWIKAYLMYNPAGTKLWTYHINDNGGFGNARYYAFVGTSSALTAHDSLPNYTTSVQKTFIDLSKDSRVNSYSALYYSSDVALNINGNTYNFTVGVGTSGTKGGAISASYSAGATPNTVYNKTQTVNVYTNGTQGTTGGSVRVDCYSISPDNDYTTSTHDTTSTVAAGGSDFYPAQTSTFKLIATPASDYVFDGFYSDANTSTTNLANATTTTANDTYEYTVTDTKTVYARFRTAPDPSSAFTFELNSPAAGEATITGWTAPAGFDGNLVIPSTYGGYTVTRIGVDAFKNKPQIITLTIPNGVTTILSGAFDACENITSVTIPASVTSIGDNSFSRTPELTSITVDPSNANYSSLDGNLYDKGQTLLIQYALGKSTPTFTIPSTLNSIASSALAKCLNLTSFSVEAGNSAYSAENGVLYNIDKTELLVYPCAKSDTSFTIPNGVTTLANNSFYSCKNIKNISIPNSVTSIGSNAFRETTITSIEIPDSVTSIGNMAFLLCSSLVSAKLPDNPYFNTLNEQLFIECTSLTSITIPNSVMRIYPSAFQNCTSLRAVTVLNRSSDSVNGLSIDPTAFNGCTNVTVLGYGTDGSGNTSAIKTYCNSLANLTFVDIEDFSYDWANADNTNHTVTLTGWAGAGDPPATLIIPPETIYNNTKYAVTEIGEEAFLNKTSVTSVVIPDGVTTIGECAFERCTALSSISFPASLTTIRQYAFDGINNLSKISVAPGSGSFCVDDGVLYDYDKTTLVLYPQKRQGTSFNIPDGVETIGVNAFEKTTSLTSITIPNTCETIKYNAFRGNTGLKSIAVPQSVTLIEANAFCDCSNLSSIAIYNSTATIESNSTTLPTLTVIYGYIGSTAATWAADASHPRTFIPIDTGFNYSNFQGDGTAEHPYTCTIDGFNTSVIGSGEGLTPVPAALMIPSETYHNGHTYTVTAIGHSDDSTGAFQEKTTVTSVYIPDSVTNIGKQAFYGCTRITSVNFGEDSGLRFIRTSAFSGCVKLAYIKIPDRLQLMDFSAFNNCYKISSVSLPSTLTTINSGAFSCCSSLVNISVNEDNPVYKDIDGVLYTKDGKSLLQFPAGRSGTFTIPSDVTKIEISCFTGTNLPKIIIPSNVESIERGAFSWSSSITECIITEMNTTFGISVFDNSNNVKVYAYKGSTAQTAAGAKFRPLYDVTYRYKDYDPAAAGSNIYDEGVENAGSDAACQTSTLSHERVAVKCSNDGDDNDLNGDNDHDRASSVLAFSNIKSNYYDYDAATSVFDPENPTELTVTLTPTPRVYHVTLNTRDLKAINPTKYADDLHYQTRIHLTADDAGQPAGTSLKWMIDDKVVYVGDTFSYYVIDDVDITTEAAGEDTMNGKSVITSAGFEKYYSGTTAMLTDEFYVQNYFNKGEGKTFVGAGTIYKPVTGTPAQESVGKLEDVISRNVNPATASYISATKDSTGYYYCYSSRTAHSTNPSAMKFVYSNALHAYHYIYALGFQNKPSYKGKNIRMYSYYIYYDGENYHTVISENYSQQSMYQP